MARKAGSTSSVRIPLSELVAKLAQFPNASVSVSKAWAGSAKEAFGVTFGAAEAAETEGDENAEADTETPARAVVDVG